MRKSKFDKSRVTILITTLNAFSRRYGLPLVRHTVSRWNNAQRDKTRFLKQKQALKKELAEVNRRLSR
jgi:hypothetical protein